jgi:hypothetical protein
MNSLSWQVAGTIAVVFFVFGIVTGYVLRSNVSRRRRNRGF